MSIGRMPRDHSEPSKRGIAAALRGQIDRGRDGVVADRLHARVGEAPPPPSEAIGQAQRLQRVLEAHDAEADRAMPQVGVAAPSGIV